MTEEIETVTKKRKTDTEFEELRNEVVQMVEGFDEEVSINVLRMIHKIAQAKKVPIDICSQCDELDFTGDTFRELEASKWGDLRMYCSNCVNHCKHCDGDYCDGMSYRHTDCADNVAEHNRIKMQRTQDNDDDENDDDDDDDKKT